MGEQDWESVDKILQMLLSKDKEMWQLGLTLASKLTGIPMTALVAEGELLRAEMTRFIYRAGITDAATQSKIISFAREAKEKSLKAEMFERACFWRDVERSLFLIKE